MIMGLVARSDIEDAVEFTGKLADFLTEKEVNILLDIPLAQKLGRYQDKQWALDDMDVDMVVAVGGDGAMLRTQSDISRKKSHS
jgi:NAD+ kinase